jgi:hypothetical protein
MAADDDPDMMTINAAWGSYQVRRDSLAAMALDPERLAREDAELIERGRMAWSLGTELADLLWMLVPEARPALVELFTKELSEGERYDRFLTPPTHAEVCDALYLDVLLPAVSDIAGQRDVVRRCLAVLHRVIHTADGDFRWETVDRHIVRSLEREGFRDLLTEIHPEFMALVHRTRTALGQN